MTWFFQVGFPHSEIFGSQLDRQLPEAYGRHPPPSSPPDAKASTKSPFQLITKFVVTQLEYLIYENFKEHKKNFYLLLKNVYQIILEKKRIYQVFLI